MSINPIRKSQQHGAAKHVFILILLAAVAAGLGLWFAQRHHTTAPTNQQTPRVAEGNLIRYPKTKALQHADLISPEGAFNTEQLKGRWHWLFIGFTHCPDICPTTLTMMGQTEKLLNDLPDEQKPRIVFLSVDGKRDTPEITQKYVHYFSKEGLALTGHADQIDPFIRQLGMVYMINTPKDASQPNIYNVDHSASIAVLNPNAELVAVIRPPHEPKSMAKQLRQLVQEGKK